MLPILIFLLCAQTQAAGPKLTKISETQMADSAFDGNNPYWYLNAVIEQRDQLVTYKGWQYATYYKQKTSVTDRHVAICRRQLPSGAWESFDFGDYIQSTNDDHNGIAMGICPNDGTIHLAFDHHVNPLHYRRSQTDVANHPASYTWSASLFGPVGGNIPPNAGSAVTYPKFTATPDGNLLFEFRDGGSGAGDEILYKYSGASNSWTRMGKYIDGITNDNNAYINGMQFDNLGRLHITWGWRETPDGATEHDFLYAYSPDTGSTWYTSAGVLAGTIGGAVISSTSTPSALVWSIPQNHGLWDSEGLGVDRQNRIHTLIAHDTLGLSKLFHYYRDDSGTWHCNYTGITHPYQIQRVVFDSDNNAYVALGGGSIIAASSPNWTDWRIIDSTENGRFLYCALVDGALARDSMILSVMNQGTTGPNSKKMVVINYRMGGGTGVDGTKVSIPGGSVNISDAAFKTMGDRILLPKGLGHNGIAGLYDVGGKLLGRANFGPDGVVNIDRARYGDGLIVVRVKPYR